MAVASKGLLTEINEDDTIYIALLVNFETLSYIKGYHEYQKSGHLFFKKSFVEKWNLLTKQTNMR